MSSYVSDSTKLNSAINHAERHDLSKKSWEVLFTACYKPLLAGDTAKMQKKVLRSDETKMKLFSLQNAVWTGKPTLHIVWHAVQRFL